MCVSILSNLLKWGGKCQPDIPVVTHKDLKAGGVAQNILKIHLYKIKNVKWLLLILVLGMEILVLGMEIGCILWKAKEIFQKAPCGAPTWISPATSLPKNICGDKPKDLNQIKTCPSGKRLMRAKGLNGKSASICGCASEFFIQGVQQFLCWSGHQDLTPQGSSFSLFPPVLLNLPKEGNLQLWEYLKAEIQPKLNPPDL